MEASVVSLGIAALAVVVALVASVNLARQRPRGERTEANRDAASTPPVSVSLAREGRDAHWRIEVLASSPPTSIDILSYRATGSGGAWENEPIVEPVLLQPGGWAVLPHVVVGRAPSYDVVVGWTEHRPDGRRTASAAVTVHETGPLPAPAVGRHGGWIVTAVAIVALLLVAGAVVVNELVTDSSDDESATPPTFATTTPVTESPVRTTVPATTSVSTTITASLGPAPSIAPLTTVPTTPPPTTSPDGPTVVASGRIEDCRFGTDCLVVGFRIDGFDGAPTEYVCVFDDGARVQFNFGGDGVTTACSARSEAPSITIEVDGVRSNTVTPDDLGPTP